MSARPWKTISSRFCPWHHQRRDHTRSPESEAEPGRRVGRHVGQQRVMQQTPRPQSMPRRMGCERGAGLRSGGWRGSVSIQGHGLAPHQASAGRHIEAGGYRHEHYRHPASGLAVFISPPRSHCSWHQASTRCRTNTEKPLRTKRDPSQLFASTRRAKPQQHGPTRLPVTQAIAAPTPVGSVSCLLKLRRQLASCVSCRFSPRIPVWLNPDGSRRCP